MPPPQVQTERLSFIDLTLFYLIFMLYVGVVDTIIETLVGGAQYAYMRNSRDDAVQRRILIAKWLCVQGFLTNDFPVTERYVPVHIQEELEREMED